MRVKGLYYTHLCSFFFFFACLSLAHVIDTTLVVNGFLKVPKRSSWNSIIFFAQSSAALFILTDWSHSFPVQYIWLMHLMYYPRVILILHQSSASKVIHPKFSSWCILSFSCCLFPRFDNSVSNLPQRWWLLAHTDANLSLVIAPIIPEVPGKRFPTDIEVHTL